MTVKVALTRILSLLPSSVERTLRCWHHLRAVKNITEQEEPDLVLPRKFVKPGDLVIDIGANIGIYTRTLAEIVGPTGAVLSFEPVPMTFEILRFVVQQLGYSNVVLFPVALSSAAEQVKMTVPATSTGESNFYRAKIGISGGDTFSVNAYPLDLLLAHEKRRVSFVKVDVEGAELAVIRGARETIERWKPVLLVEVSGDPDQEKTSAVELFRLFAELGYEPFLHERGAIRKRERGEQAINYLFVPKSEA